MIGRSIAIGIALMIAQICPANARSFTPKEQLEVVEAAAKMIEDRYVDAPRAREIAAELRRSKSRWVETRDGETFAKSMTDYLQTISHDGHLGLSYSAQAISEGTGEAGFSNAEMQKWYGPQLNHGIEKIERLEGNVILLDLRVFPPATMAGDVFAAAMTIVAQGEALIVDLRHNGGGVETANLFTGYLLKGGSPLTGAYDRPSNTHRHENSPLWVPGRRFGEEKPVYILTSKRTFSAAEAFAYNLQVLKRAVIVGETTGGGAHPFEYRRVHPHFALDLPESKSIHPITGTNWQGVGVKPDVPVPADRALDEALRLARMATPNRQSH